jgi:hypothetical protein
VTNLPSSNRLILFLGADWWGSDSRALAVALRQLGHVLIEANYENFFPLQWSSLPLRVLRRCIRPWCAANYNRTLLPLARNRAIDFVLVFKGMLLTPEVLAAFRARSLPMYCFYPDVSFLDHGGNIWRCLPHYDCLFTTKSFHLDDPALRRQARRIQLLPHGFDPAVHRPIALSERARAQYGCDVSFVGCWSPKKERLLAALLQGCPRATVRVWGPGWGRAQPDVRRCWQGRGAYGDELAVVYAASSINLGLLSEAGGGTGLGDQTTARTWQIPGAGAFMLHEATAELERFFAPGSEVGVFSGAEDLVSQVRFFLRHPEQRCTLANAARQRCLDGGYTYDLAAQAICRYHEENKKACPEKT